VFWGWFARSYWLAVQPARPPGLTPIVIRGGVSGSTLTIPLPRTLLGASKKYHFPGVEMVLVSLKLSAPALGSGPNALITAGRCTSHRFVVTSQFVYADHSRRTLTSSSSCSQGS
jgi:hypothetical protein